MDGLEFAGTFGDGHCVPVDGLREDSIFKLTSYHHYPLNLDVKICADRLSYLTLPSPLVVKITIATLNECSISRLNKTPILG